MAGRLAGMRFAALASAGAGSFWLWHALTRRPLPQTRGQVSVRGLESRVTIGRDRFGVPRIEARSLADMCFAQGFCVGQERLWQLEFYRRITSGRISEFAGPAALKVDRLMRTLGLRRVAEAEVATIDRAARSYLEAYAAGVNAAREAARALPLELQLLRIDPEPWTPADSLAAGKLLALGFSTNMETELFRAELVSAIGAEKAARLEPRYPAGNPIVTQPGVGWQGEALELAAQIAEVREAIGLGLEPVGSNNWAVSGERSVTGAPLLAGDPHIASSMPGIWYCVDLSTPEFELRGGSIPGFPGVFIGQSPHVAWSLTNVLADVQDLYVERVRSAHEAHQPTYEFEGEWRELKVTRERIAVRGRAHPEVLEVWESHHGPIVNDALGGYGEPLALSWTALQLPWPVRLAVDIGAVRSGAELVDEFRDFTLPCMNLVWADARGDIGYKLIGKLPLRRGGTPDMPKPGWTGEYEWDGYIPYDELPEIVNPPGGTIVTANNRIAPDDYPHHITSEYLDGYRAARIEQMLAERERHSLDDFARMQVDMYSIPGAETARRLTQLEASGQREVRAIERLRSWDHRLDTDTIAGTIYEAFTAHFARAVSEAVIGDTGLAERWRARSLMGLLEMTTSLWRFQSRLLELWEEGDEQLIGGRSWDELALASLSSALDELEERFGGDPAGWKWGRVHGLRFPHALANGNDPLARTLDRLLSRRLPAGGSQETVCQVGFAPFDGDYTGTWAPSYRLLADLGDPDRTRWQHFTGQSGHPASPHYDDLMQDWLGGRTNPVCEPAVDTLRLDPA